MLAMVCLAWLYPFACILIYGSHTVGEPRLPILFGEIALFVGLAVYGIGCAVSGAKKEIL